MTTLNLKRCALNPTPSVYQANGDNCMSPLLITLDQFLTKLVDLLAEFLWRVH